MNDPSRPVNQTWPLLDRWRLKRARKRWIRERRANEFYLCVNGFPGWYEYRLENVKLGVWN